MWFGDGSSGAEKEIGEEREQRRRREDLMTAQPQSKTKLAHAPSRSLDRPVCVASSPQSVHH